MANKEHLDMLKKGTKAWNEWRNANPYEKKDLSGADLSKQDYSGVQLHSADLSGARLRGTKLKGAWLQSADLSSADLGGADLSEAKLGQANLSGADLREAKLTEADFKRANLSDANLNGQILKGVNLRKANLTKANLTGADFRGAGLVAANFTRADLTSATFGNMGLENCSLAETIMRDCNLERTNLSGSMLLTTLQLAGTNLFKATLPTAIGEFTELDRIEEISKHGRKTFFTLVAVCVFSWLTIVGATDVGLVTNRAATPLPLIQATVPIASFFYFMPAALIVLYVYFHLSLRDFWSGLGELPAIFQDGRTLDRRAYPWLITSIVQAHVPRLKEKRPAYSYLQVGLAKTGAWILVPFTVMWFWFSYLPIGNLTGTLWHIFLILLVTWFGYDSYTEAIRRLLGKPPSDAKRRSERTARFPSIRFLPLFVAFVVAVLCVACYFVSLYFLREPNVPNLVRSWAIPDLRFAELSEKLKGFDKEKLTSSEVPTRVRPAFLRAQDFRYVPMRGAFLVRADLERADLKGADLSAADLRGATVIGANLEMAVLDNADLSKADLSGANLSEARLSGANLFMANLSGADLSECDLSGVDLSTVTGLTHDQLRRACGDERTKLPSHLQAVPIRRCQESSAR